MPNKMLIDATHPEETRVVVVRGNRVEEFDFETAQRKQLRGNIYLAKVTRVEPSLQAAFIEYGGNRHGFLAFSEIHPDYYQIPVADRQALIEADERAHREAEEESENRSSRRRQRHRSSRRRSGGERVQSEIVGHTDADSAQAAPQPLEGQPFHDHDAPRHEDAEGTHAEHGYAAQEEHLGHAGHAHAEHDHAGADHHVEHSGHDDHDDHEHSHDHSHHDARDHDEHDDDEAHEPAAGDMLPAAMLPDPAAAKASDADGAEPPTRIDAAHAEHGYGGQEHGHSEHGHNEDDHDEHDHDEHDHEAYAAEDAGHEVSHALSHDAPLAVHDGDAAAARGEEDGHDDDEEGDDAEEELVESVGGDDVLEEVPERPFRPRRQYKIQEVIKRRQVMLVQVVKEERGNKGAALTTYLSLAGRYAVLMPNTARGGGISRKITSAQDRSRLKEVVQELDVPDGMGIILRTAGASRTKPEIKRDFEYLIRMWETVRDMTLKSQAPTLVYEEGSLIKRSLRDLYNKEIDEILVAGEAGYHEAHDFMKMLMPSNVRAVKQYRDGQPLFSRMGVESQLDAMFSPTVQLRSGGYIVINQTEALVSIDVNSGRATREHHIEDTALKTNMEAAEEVARQLRLRDLAGLIVIDFIDMDEKRNNRSVERKLSDCLRQDRARIQVGRISHFGLLEMSRQRIRASVLESSTEPCPQCGGTGHVRSVSSVALQLLRGLEEILMKGATHNLVVRTRTDVALYVLNHKRGHLRDLESSFKVTLAVIADPSVSGQQSFVIDRGEQVHTLEAAKALLVTQAATAAALPEEPFEDEETFDSDSDSEFESEVETEETEGLTEDVATGEAGDGEQEGPRRKRRRRRRGRAGEPREGVAPRDGQVVAPVDAGAVAEAEAQPDDGESDEDESDEQPNLARADQAAGGERRPRRRGRRGGRRRRGGPEDGLAGSIADELAPPARPEALEAVADFDSYSPAPALPEVQPESIAPAPEPELANEPPLAAAPAPMPDSAEQESEKAARRRSTVREKVTFLAEAPSAAAPANVSPPEQSAPSSAPSQPATEPAGDGQPRRAGWWSRRFGSGE
jgi:ribonuclease E